MRIQSVKLKNFKNISEATVIFKDKTTGIYGPNGTGKTSVLEALGVVKSYLEISNDKPNNFAFDYMSLNQSEMEIEITVSDTEYFYKYGLKFRKILDGNILEVSSETFHIAPVNRKVWNKIFYMENDENDEMPSITVKHKRTKSYVKPGRQLYYQFVNYNSLLSLVSSIKDESEEMDVFKKFNRLKFLFEHMIISMLSENAMAQLQVFLPIQFHTHNMYGVLPLDLRGRYQKREHVNFLKDVINNVNNIYSTLFPDKYLHLKENGSKIEDGEEVVSVTLYVCKGELSISIERESTGTMKLISLLSALVAYVENEDFVLCIDELDAHIFEYLLATLIGEMSLLAKGQLIFTAHNLSPLERLSPKSILFSTEKAGNITFEYLKNIRGSNNTRNKYLRAVAYGVEDNIEGLGINESALKMFIGALV